MNKKSSIKRLLVFGGFIYLFSGVSCEKEDFTRSLDMNDDTENIEDGSGISLILDNDSLEEDCEKIYFNSEEWNEEGINVDL